MWSYLGIDNWVFKFEKIIDSYMVYITNFIRIWSSRLENEEIVNTFKEMNSLLEAPKSEFVNIVLSLFDSIQSVEKKVEEHEDKLILYLMSDLKGIKFRFQLSLKQQEADVLFKEITLPLIILASRLKKREDVLAEIISKKDAEINEYKQENTCIKRMHLITTEFNRREFEEREETDYLHMLVNNPSVIFNIIDAKMFEISRILKIEKTGVSDTSVGPKFPDSSEGIKVMSGFKETKKNGLSVRETRRKIVVPVNASTKRRKGSVKSKLKL